VSNLNAEEYERYQKELEKQQYEVIKKAAMLKFMTKGARERLNRVKLVKPEIAAKIEDALIQSIQTGQVRGQITEQQIISILNEVTERKNFRILRR
jgi:programmed cell death protein 5